MNKTTHTSGPWQRNIKPAKKYPTVFSGRNKHVTYVATEGLSEEEVEANIDLITAAPQLLEALECSRDVELSFPSGIIQPPLEEKWAERFREIFPQERFIYIVDLERLAEELRHRAISKARGKSNAT